jgi:hypothetical protein
MQIGRQLNRNTPKLESDRYSQGLKDLISFALESNPSARPTMAEILAHPYLADTDEAYPTSSVSELVRNYYQWSQRGGQRISLFHPGGAAAAELPGAEESEDDWSFSTTDGFERRFSVIDLDQIAASLVQMEEAINPTTPTADIDFSDDVPLSDEEMNPEEKANFDERVRRGAAAMEGLFNEELPSYTYETKNDFVPIDPSPPSTDLPLRTETDRSSVTSTFIDIDIGSFDSSHYAAGAAATQPFQLADADTIRANRTLQRNSNEPTSESDPLHETFKPQSGPRPPTMDWKFPTFTPPEEEEEEEESSQKTKEISVPEPIQEDPVLDPALAEKRATMEWTFPVMAPPPEEHEAAVETDRHDTVKGPVPSLQRQATDDSAISRPSTSASNKSTMSDSDYDPFRFDRPATPEGTSSVQHTHFFKEEFPAMMETIGYNEFEASGLLDGPGPDEESQPLWEDGKEVMTPSYMPLRTAIPQRESSLGPSASSTSEPGSPIFAALPTARREPDSRATIEGSDDLRAISFPALVPPSAESLMEGVNDGVLTLELDRLLGDFLDSLSATGEALSKARLGYDENRTDDTSEQAQ